jgi:hypothetical protein
MTLVVVDVELVDAEVFLAGLFRLPKLLPVATGRLPDELIRSYGTELLPSSVGAGSTDWRLLEDDLDDRKRLFILGRGGDHRDVVEYALVL